MGLLSNNDTLFSQIPTPKGIKSHVAIKAGGDKYIWGIVVLLALISILVVYSATGSLAYKMQKGNNEFYLMKQIFYLGFGLCIIYFSHKINYYFYSKLATVFFFIAIPLLIYTFLFGVRLNEGSRWIRLPIINLTFQSSDFARLALFMFLSRQLSRKQEVIKSFKKGFWPVFWPVLVICGLILPANLSTALLTGATAMVIMFIGRVSSKHLLLLIGLATAVVMGLVMLATLTYEESNQLKSGANVKEKIADAGRLSTWVKRVQDFIYAENNEEPYQVQQAKIAIANGSILMGLGPGNSRQRNFLPHSYSDFIYAIIIEEYGLLGGAFLIIIYLAFLFRCIRIFKRCPYAFGAFLALALSFTLVIQALANMAVNVNLVPVTGVTLPLVSMGGSSFLFNCAAIGIILSVARNVEQLEGAEPAKIVVPIPVEGLDTTTETTNTTNQTTF